MLFQALFILFSRKSKENQTDPINKTKTKPHCGPDCLPRTTFCSSLPHAPNVPLNIKEIITNNLIWPNFFFAKGVFGKHTLIPFPFNFTLFYFDI